MPRRSAHPCAPIPAFTLLAAALAVAFAGPAFAKPSAEIARSLIGSPAAPIGEAPVDLSPADLAAVQAVRTGPGRLPQLMVAVDGDAGALALPLEETRVFAEVTGFIARVDVVQTYRNPFAEPIEAVYTFPLPENSAVDDLTMRIGERVIRAEIQKRDDARKTYAAAKAQGHTAALLEQERPNIFTQSVANIAPGESIEVSLRYVQHLTYDAGTYEFVFPMVVGPRFMPGQAIGKQGPGWAADTDVVPDASRISPPVIGAGLRSGHDIHLEVIVEAGLPVVDLQTPTHRVDAHTTAEGSLNVRLADGDRIPNRDFVLRYAVGGKAPRAAAFAAPGPVGEGGVVSLMVQPPQLDLDALVGQREIIFVVDVSGSMSGVPLSQAKAAMQRALRGLGPDDTFNVHTFAGHSARAFAGTRPANKTNIERALRFIDEAQAGGGTHLADAVQQALGDVGPGRHRYVVFLTDGYVGNEKQIFAGAEALVTAQARAGRKARVFGMGIGSSVNRHLIDGLARAGDGTAMYVLLDEMPDGAIDRLYRTIDHPVLTDVRIDWADLAVEAVEPAVMPDLLATQPLIVLAKYTEAGSGLVKISGKMDGRDVTLSTWVELPPLAAGTGSEGDGRMGDALPSLWARARVESLSRRLWRGHDTSAIEAITDIGLKYRLVTAYTSFVAVDRSRVVGDGSPAAVIQPVQAPAGVNPAMAMPAHGVITGGGSGQAYGVGGMGMVGRGSGGGGVGYGRGVMRRTVKRGRAAAPKVTVTRQAAPPRADVASGAARAAVSSGDGELGGTAVGGGLGLGGPGRVVSQLGGKARRRPRIQSGQPVVMGSLDKAVIQRVIRRHRAEYQYCYEKALNADPTLQGKLVLRLHISADGKVARAEVLDEGSTLESEAVRTCVARRAQKWQFPAPKSAGLVIVTYPLVFMATE